MREDGGQNTTAPLWSSRRFHHTRLISHVHTLTFSHFTLSADLENNPSAQQCAAKKQLVKSVGEGKLAGRKGQSQRGCSALVLAHKGSRSGALSATQRAQDRVSRRRRGFSVARPTPATKTIINRQMFVECLLCARPCYKYFTHVNSILATAYEGMCYHYSHFTDKLRHTEW